MPDPELPINCPMCGRPLIYVRSECETHFYWCLRDGSITWATRKRT